MAAQVRRLEPPSTPTPKRLLLFLECLGLFRQRLFDGFQLPEPFGCLRLTRLPLLPQSLVFAPLGSFGRKLLFQDSDGMD